MEWPSSLVEQIKEAAPRVVIIKDPDRLLLQEQLLGEFQAAGCVVMTIGDPIYLRHAWESRFQESSVDALTKEIVMLRLEQQRFEDVPYDIWQGALRLDLSLAGQFELLDARVIRSLTPDDLISLKKTYDTGIVTTHQGEKATIRFVLAHIFGISPDTWRSVVDVLRVLLVIHYRGQSLPDIIVDALERLMREIPGAASWPLRQLLNDRQSFFIFLQDHWIEFLQREATGQDYGEVPFGDAEIRIYLDNLFTEGFLQPVRFEVQESLPQWAISGVLSDPEYYQRQRLAKLTVLLQDNLPEVNGRYQEWQRAALRVAEIEQLLAQTDMPLESEQEGSIYAALRTVRESFSSWFERRQGPLASLMIVSQPVMLHHIPHFLAWRRAQTGAKIALVVLDGMSLQQWLTIRSKLAESIKNLRMDEGQVFALVPTLTSICRQAIFSGELPYQFGGSVFNNQGEERSWRSFWTRQQQALITHFPHQGNSYLNLEREVF